MCIISSAAVVDARPEQAQKPMSSSQVDRDDWSRQKTRHLHATAAGAAAAEGLNNNRGRVFDIDP